MFDQCAEAREVPIHITKKLPEHPATSPAYPA
jgi:hypothetical protein